MHVEIQVALNFLISFLYNKLPRRRVNQFGEELENALKVKFEGHWYPEKPYKGSAYRCVRCTPPLDPTVFDTAARASGMDLNDIQENFPQELSIWIDPGEVSYRMSEKGPVKILYSEKSDHNIERDSMDQREVTRTFNPEAQCFKPIECIASQFGQMNISSSTSSNSYSGDSSPPTYGKSGSGGSGSSGSPITSFMVSKTSTPVTFTTATFAQTKFGSTKLKSNSKRSHRMSPTEFSNYIKQRALLQQQAAAAQQSPIGISQMAANNTLYSASTSPHNSRSLSPNLTQLDSANGFMLMAAANGANSPTNTGTYGNSPQSAYPPTNSSSDSNRAAFISGLFDNGYLSELVGNVSNVGSVGNGCVGELAKSASNQQNKANGMNRFTSFLDKASPFISQPNNSSPTNANNTFTASNLNFGSFTPENTVNGTSGNANNSNSSKAFDISYNMKGVSYPNQYQHLLVAN